MKRLNLNVIVFSLCLFFCSAGAYAEDDKWEPVIVALPDAEINMADYDANSEKNYSTLITKVLEKVILDSGKALIKNENDIAMKFKNLKDSQVAKGNCTSDSCMMEIMKKMQATYGCKLSIDQTDNVYLVTIKMIKMDPRVKEIPIQQKSISSKTEIFDTVQKLGARIASDLPSLEARVTGLDAEENVYINLGETSGIKKNSFMIVKRKTQVTNKSGKVIATKFEDLGTIVIDEVYGDSSRGKIKKKIKEIQEGDSAFIDDEMISKMKEEDLRQKKLEQEKQFAEEQEKLEKQKRANEKRLAEERERLKRDQRSQIDNSLDAQQERKIAERKLETYLYLRAGGGVAQMKDQLLSDLYTKGSLFMAEAVIGSNSFGLYGRFTHRAFKMEDDILSDPVAIDAGIISLSEVEINSGDLGLRLYFGPEFYNVIFKLYVSGAARYSTYTEVAENGIEYKFTALGWVYGAGAELTFFNTIGFFAEYNGGSCKIGESKRDIEGHQFLAGVTLKI